MKGITMHTNSTVLSRYDISDLAIEFPDAEVPVLTGSQRQGDVLVLAVDPSAEVGEPIGKGVTVVRAETNSANTHTLHGDGLWLADPNTGTGLTQGRLTVPQGGEAFLIHTEEHNAIGIGEGTYEIRRQREFQGEWRRVAD